MGLGWFTFASCILSQTRTTGDFGGVVWISNNCRCNVTPKPPGRFLWRDQGMVQKSKGAWSSSCTTCPNLHGSCSKCSRNCNTWCIFMWLCVCGCKNFLLPGLQDLTAAPHTIYILHFQLPQSIYRKGTQHSAQHLELQCWHLSL